MHTHTKTLLAIVLSSSSSFLTGCASGGATDERQSGSTSALDETVCRGRPMPPIPEDGIRSQGGMTICSGWRCNASLGWMPTGCEGHFPRMDGAPNTNTGTSRSTPPPKSGGDTIRDKMSSADGEGSEQPSQVASAEPSDGCSDDSCDGSGPPAPTGDSSFETAQSDPACSDPDGCAGDVGTASLHPRLW